MATRIKTENQTIVVNELPYQVNKAKLIEKIADQIETDNTLRRDLVAIRELLYHEPEPE